MTLPSPTLDSPPETLYAGGESPHCDRTDKPGVEAFRAFVKHTLGYVQQDYGTDRPCDVGDPSDHWWRGAWDWHVLADDPRVDELLGWLLANDGELYRRAGLKYIIWNRQRMPNSTGALSWGPYTGPNPHTDHVHFSFSRAGAAGQTSLYPWLQSLGYGGPSGTLPGPGPQPSPAAPETSAGGGALAFVAGFALGYATTQVVRWL